MKSIYFIITISFSLLSCVDSGKCEEDNGTLVNNSGKDIVITSYKNNIINIPLGTISRTTPMLNNSNITKNGKKCPPVTASVGFGDLGDDIII